METRKTELGVDSGQMSVANVANLPESRFVQYFRVGKDGATYYAYKETSEGGMRVKRLVVSSEPLVESGLVEIGEFGAVDGWIVVGDPCYYLEGASSDAGPGYGDACRATCVDGQPEINAGIFQPEDGRHGVCSSSGYGDGGYPMTAEVSEISGLQKVEIIFIEDEEDC